MDLAALNDKDALTIFSMEIWNLILLQIQDFEDVESVLEAFPSLSGLPLGIRFCWKIDELMPLLFPKYLCGADILLCRLVSKTWKNEVSTLFENHHLRSQWNSVDRNALDHKHFNYFPLPNIYTHFNRFLPDEEKRAASKNQAMTKFSNPFLGGVVKIGIPLAARCRETLSSTFYDICVFPPLIPTLRLYGENIRHIYFFLIGRDFRGKDFVRNTIELILLSLTSFPNLRLFKLISTGSYIIRDKLNRVVKALKIPAMVESLELPRFPAENHTFSKMIHQAFFDTFVNHEQIKFLQIDCFQWKNRYGPCLPNLAELHIMVSPGEEIDLNQISQILESIRSPYFKKLGLPSLNNLDMFDLLQVLIPYKIESLNLFGGVLTEDLERSDIIVSTVTSLKIFLLPKAKLHFLKCLPNLQYLTISIILGLWNSAEDFPSEEQVSPVAMCFRRFVRDFRNDPQNFQCIWTELNNLKMLTIHMDDRVSTQYVAEAKNKVFTSLSCPYS